MNLSKISLKLWNYDHLRAYVICILPETCFATEKCIQCTHMLSSNNTRGINSRIRELIQQMAITR